MKKSIKEWLHYPILLIAIFLSSFGYMNYIQKFDISPIDNSMIWLFWFFIVELVVLIVVDKALHRWFIKEGVR